MSHLLSASRLLASAIAVVLVSTSLDWQVAAVDPSPDPVPAPSAGPELPQSATPSAPTLTPPSDPTPPREPEPDPASEVLPARTATSQTYALDDGTYVTDLYPEPAFYQPEGTSAWQPIELTFEASVDANQEASVTSSPVEVRLRPFAAAGGFLSLSAQERTITFDLPLAAVARPAAVPAVRSEGAYAELRDLLAGGVDLRVFPRPDGVKTFLVLESPLAAPAYTFVVRSPGLSLAAEPDGSLAFRDGAGQVAGRIPRPFLVDSSDIAGEGGGIYSEAVSMALTKVAGETAITLTPDPAVLATATYPVYLDPTVTTFPNDTGSAADTFASEASPTTNFDAYQRPDAPFYFEHWLGEKPSVPGKANQVFLKFAGLAAVIDSAHIDTATLKVYPYHQAQSPSTVWIKRITESWAAGSLTWATRPAQARVVFPDETSLTTSAGATANFDVTNTVQAWMDGVVPNNGLMLHENGNGSTYWKRLIAREEGGSDALRLRVEWHRPIATASSPVSSGYLGTDRRLTWSYDDNDTAASNAQSHYQVQVSASSTFATLLADGDSGVVAGTATSWVIPTSVTLSAGGTYYWRVKVKDGTGWSAWSAGAVFRQSLSAGDVTAAITAPVSSAHVKGTVTFSGTAAGSTFASYTLARQSGCSVPASSGTYTDVIAGGDPITTPVNNGTLGIWATGALNGQYGVRLRVDQTGGGLPAFDFLCITVDNTPATATLATPPLAGAAPIVGIATDALGFKEYVLEWAPGANAASGWQLIDAARPTYTVPVTAASADAPLGTWDTTGLQGPYSLRLTVRDKAGNPDSVTTQNVYVENALPADDAFTAVPFDMGGGWTASVGTDDGGLTLARHLFTIPSYGAPASMTLSHRSRSGSSADRLGAGWSSDLTQRLSFQSGFVLWHTADGSVVPFGQAGGAWKPLLGRYETLSHDATAGSYTVTLPDQSRLVFADAAPGRLKRIEDRFGNGLGFTWSASSATVTDASGRTTSITIDSGTQRIAGVTDSAGRGWSFAYSGGELTALTDPAGAVTSLAYTSGDLTSVSRTRTLSGSPQTISWSFGYASGRVASVTDPEGGAHSPVRRHTFTYLEGQTTAALLRDLSTGTTATTTYHLDARSRVVREIDPLGYETALTLDAAGNETETTQEVSATHSVTHRSTWDTKGNLLTEEAPVAGGATVRTTNSYNATNDLTGVRENRLLAGGGEGAELPGRMSAVITAGRISEVVVNPSAAASERIETSYTYTADDQVATATASDGVITKYEYDGHGNRTAMIENHVAGQPATAERNVRTEAAYDQSTTAGKAGLVTSETDPLGRVTRYEYDALGRLTKTVRSFVSGSNASDTNLETRTLYDQLGWPSASVDERGFVTRSVTDRLGRVTKVIANCTDSGVTPSSIQANCLGTGTHNASTNVVTDSAYDAMGNVTRDTVRDPSGAAGDVATAHAYDATGRETRTIVDEGTGKLNLTTETAYDGMGRAIASKDPGGTVTTTIYDNAGNVTRTITNCTISGTTPPTSGWETCAGTGTVGASANLTTEFTYDEGGNQLSQTAPNGRRTSMAYDALDRIVSRTENDVTGTPGANQDLVTTYAYDLAGREIGVRSPTADRMTFSVTATRYDALGREKERILNCTDSGTTVPAIPSCGGSGTKDADTNLATSGIHDAVGNRMSQTSPSPSAPASGSGVMDGVTTHYAYDRADRLCRVLENGSMDLQSLGNPCSTQVSGTMSSDVSTRYGYDRAGNLTSMVDARGNEQTYGFDALGRMTSRTDGLGNVVIWRYDERGNRTEQVNRIPGVSIAWTYDGAERMTSRTADGVTVTFSHDTTGNQLTAQGPDGTITATYDRLAQILTVDADDGADTAYTYSHTAPTRMDPSGSYTFSVDRFGRETGATTPLSATPFGFAYRADGQPATKNDPNGNTTAYGYDNADRLLTKVTTGAGGSPTRTSYAYTYNRAGLRLSEASAITDDPANGTASFTYDALGRLTGYNSPLGPSSDQGYGWQEVPNRSSLTTGSSTVTTAYDSANRPTTDSAGRPYSHDLDGRLSAHPGQTLEWDSLGRLTKVRDASTSSVISAYTYDALDRLRTVERSTGIMRFRYVGLTAQVAEIVDDETGASQDKVGHSWSGHRLMSWVGTNLTVLYHGLNGHGDTTWTADSTGAISGVARYDPWGVVLATGGLVPDWRFQSSWVDTATGHSWVATRWYAPELGRFLSEDTLLGDTARPGSRHLYAYGSGSPISHWDPDGRESLYRGKKSSYYYRPFSHNTFSEGRLVLALFIKKDWVKDIPGVWGRGDDRGFRYGGDCSRARACIIIDYDRSHIFVVARPSCGKWLFFDYDCRDARSFSRSREDNYLFTSVYSGGQVAVRWHLNQSFGPRILDVDISGYIIAQPRRFVRLGIDNYPSAELYYTESGNPMVTMMQKSEDSFWSLGGGLDHFRTWSWPGRLSIWA